MIKNILIAFLFCSQFGIAQIDFTQLIVGRNTGNITLHDGATPRIFGFAENLADIIEIPGPIIRMTEGDSVLIDFLNMSQGAPHTIHLHGLDVDQANDGVPTLSFQVNHSEHGYYRFKAPHAGTYIYHCHVVSTIHTQAGMYGVIIVDPPAGNDFYTWAGGEQYDRDFVWNASEIDTFWHKNSVLNHLYDAANPQPVYVPDVYAPQYFLINGKSDSQLADPSNFYYVIPGENVYTRLVNIGYYGVRYIFPNSLQARTISSDGRPLPQVEINDTIEVLPGERYGTMIQIGNDNQYFVNVEYFDLNTQVVASTQTIVLQSSQVDLIENGKNQLRVFPNPSTSGLYISSVDFTEKYKIYNLMGELILESNDATIDIQSAPSGIYIFKYNGSSIKLIKN